MYDYLIIGSGLFGLTFAQQMKEKGKKVLVVEKRNHVGGNIYTEAIEGITVHQYGPHLFHTSNKKIWDYVNRFTTFNNYQHKPMAFYQGKVYSLPFNMLTYHQLWGVTTPKEAQEVLNKQKVNIENPQNLEEWSLSQVGTDIYEKLIYGYSKKNWMCDPKELPASIIKRLPLRMTYDPNYFNDLYQGVPTNGYTEMVENMADGIDIKLNTMFYNERWENIAKKLVYSGPIDKFFNYKYGELEYRTSEFKTEVLDEKNFQGIGQMNYTDEKVPWTRIIEHKHFLYQKTPKTAITYEFPKKWERGKEPYLPVNTKRNNKLYKKYRQEANNLENVVISGRLGLFAYFDMHQILGCALKLAKSNC